MNITFVNMPDADRERRLFWAAAHQSVLKIWTICSLLIVVGAGVAVAGFAVANRVFGVGGLVLAALGVWMLFIPWILFRSASRRNSGNATKGVTIHLTDDDANFETSLSQACFKWPMVKRIDERNGFWIARGERRLLFTLAQECMAPEQVTEFQAFLAGRTAPQANPAS